MSRVFICIFTLVIAASPVMANSAFEKTYTIVVDGLKKSCDGKEKCLETASTLAWFLWNNREKRHFHKVMTKCIATIAYKRGYVMKPMSMFTSMNAVEAIDISVDVCNCTIGYWDKEPICREALDSNDPTILMHAIAN